MTNFDDLFESRPELFSEAAQEHKLAVEAAERDNSRERRESMRQEAVALTALFEELCGPKQDPIKLTFKNRFLLSQEERTAILDESRVDQRPNLPTARG